MVGGKNGEDLGDGGRDDGLCCLVGNIGGGLGVEDGVRVLAGNGRRVSQVQGKGDVQDGVVNGGLRFLGWAGRDYGQGIFSTRSDGVGEKETEGSP